MNGLGSENCMFPKSDTVLLMPDQTVYTLDEIFTP